MRLTLYKSVANTSLFLAILCFLGVITFHFPEFLTNPQLRKAYDVEQMRLLLLASLYVSLGLGLIALLVSPFKVRAFCALILVMLATILGGSNVALPEDFHQKKFYLSLDLIILDLLFMSLIFVPLEKLFYLHKRKFFRPGVIVDLSHYGLNHLLMGGVFLMIVLPGTWIRQKFFPHSTPQFTGKLPIWVQVVGILLVTDFAQYWIHRLFHYRERLWQFHKIHHSSETMDWLASSRLHIFDVIVTRAVSYIPIVLLGFSEHAVHIYAPVIALQALFVHSNIRFTLGPLKYVLTTPPVHHWHHSSDEKALDKNFAVTFSFFDILFETYYCPNHWPSNYGLYKERISENFLKQLTYPFIKAGRSLLHLEERDRK